MDTSTARSDRAHLVSLPSPSRRPRAGDAEWVRAARPMVERIAARLAPRLGASLGREDLVAVGFLALVELRQRNPSLSSADLERLGACRARGAMLDAMREADPLSRRTRQAARRLEVAGAAFTSRAGRAPTDEELAAAAGLSRTTTATTRALHRVTVSLDADGSSADSLPATGEPCPEDLTHRRQRLARCRKGVATLPERQQRVVSLYFGHERTLRQIGDELGVTEARVSQVLSGAVRQLRQACASIPPPAA